MFKQADEFTMAVCNEGRGMLSSDAKCGPPLMHPIHEETESLLYMFPLVSVGNV